VCKFVLTLVLTSCLLEPDCFVDHILSSKRNGFFVEIGAYDGELHSNSLFLERVRGWRGLLVEVCVCLFLSFFLSLSLGLYVCLCVFAFAFVFLFVYVCVCE